ncbi:uncharacterized protein LOC116954458 [Petromyzon marinus]|uniref:uncharacterized protein LOC116954458 n=1 Tax=Petromyzon marinus TaxID=7757 RepID=UPI003F719C72
MNPQTGRRRLNHWVEDLFPARYACTSEDLLGSGEPSTLLAAGEQARQSRALRLKDIYGTVFREQAEAAREARLKHIAGIIVREYPEESAARDDSAGSSRESEGRADGAGGVDVEELATEARCLWSEEDVAVLRRNAEEKNAQVRRLKSVLTVSEADRGELRARCERLEAALSESTRTGLAARQEADRRAMHCRQLECEVQKLQKSLGALQEVVSATQRQASQCRRDLHSARLQQQQLRARKQEIKSQLQKASQEFLLKEAELHGTMELRYKSSLAELQAELGRTREELQKERRARGRDLASLELLRRHFENLQAPRVDDCMKITHW